MNYCIPSLSQTKSSNQCEYCSVDLNLYLELNGARGTKMLCWVMMRDCANDPC